MPASKVHLVVIQHGLWGSAANLGYLTTTLAKYHGGTVSPTSAATLTPPESVDTIAVHAESHPNTERNDIRLVVLNSQVNTADLTYDGIDWCAERLVKDVYKEVERIEEDEDGQVTKLSLIGYSLGGLVVRYAAGLMYTDGLLSSTTSGSSSGKDKLKFKSRPAPASLSTIATPHLGITSTGSTFSQVASYFGSRSLGRTGKQLYLADKGWMPPSNPSSHPNPGEAEQQTEAGLCLIEALSDSRFCFVQALRLFPRVDIYANAVADLTVPYRTAAFTPHDPFILADHVKLTRDADRPPLLVSYQAIQPEKRLKSFWTKVGDKVDPKKLPWILNPQRFPFKFPLNYVAWVCLPVLLPVMMGLVLHKLKSDSKVSNKRVEGLETRWAVENGLLEDDAEAEASETGSNGKPKTKAKSKPKPLDKGLRQGWERKRISAMLSSVEADVEETLREVGEDYVGISSVSSSSSSSSPSSPASTPPETQEEADGRYVIKPNTPTISLSKPDDFKFPDDEIPLTPTQLRVVANLNNQTLLPQINKHLAHFDDVLNAHAVIIVRTATMEMHKKGMPLIRAFVERFAL